MSEVVCGFYRHVSGTLWAARVEDGKILGISGPLEQGQMREFPMKLCRFGHTDPAAASIRFSELCPVGTPWVVSGRTAKPPGQPTQAPFERQIEQVDDGFEIRLADPSFPSLKIGK